jgi:hypothetical protein
MQKEFKQNIILVENTERRDHSGDVDVDVRIISGEILK